MMLMLVMSPALGEAQFPLTDKPVTLKVMARTNSFYPNQNLGDVQIMVEYEKMTGVDIEWENGKMKNYKLDGNTDGIEIYCQGEKIK